MSGLSAIWEEVMSETMANSERDLLHGGWNELKESGGLLNERPQLRSL